VVADHVQQVMKANFAASWEEVGDENQVEEVFALSTMKDISGESVCEREQARSKRSGLTNIWAILTFDPNGKVHNYALTTSCFVHDHFQLTTSILTSHTHYT
jgi:hypothetical protein